jgi:hypothetical protein
MFKSDRMRNIKDDKLFDLWTKKLGKELPNFWSDFVK